MEPQKGTVAAAGSASGEAIADEARKWIGTPYRHQCSQRGAGTDCLGLIRGVWRALHGEEPELPPAYSPDWSEPNGEEALMAAADRHLLRLTELTGALGDVLLFRMRDGAVAKHLGIVSAATPTPKFIHAYTGHGVVESSLSGPWAKRIAAVYRFPKGAN